MLVIGTNSYITVAEADELIKGEAFAKQWESLTEDAKEGSLKSAARRINSLRFVGKKHTIFQEMEFPRDAMRDVPAAVKLAQILEAAGALDSQTATRRKLQEEGVSSITLGNASESYKSSGSSLHGLCSSDAFALLRPYLLGSGAIV